MRSRQAVTNMLRDVRENGTEYTITRAGKPVAVVVPAAKLAELRAELDRLSPRDE